MTFPVIKAALNDAPAMLFIALRMFCVVPVIIIIMLAFGFSFKYKFDKHGWGLIISYGLGFILQTYGLQYTSASRSGFLTSLYVIWVPVFAMKIAHDHVPKTSYVSIPIAVLGSALMMRLDIGGQWNVGDLLTIACAFAFAFQIVWTSRVGRDTNFMAMVLYPSLFTGLMSLPLLGLFHWDAMIATKWSNALWVAVVYTTIGGSVLALGLMNKFQPRTNAVTASLIYTGEPVFAALFAWLWFGEHLTNFELAGGTLILLANFIVQIPLPGRRPKISPAQ